MPRSEHRITEADIAPSAVYARERGQRRSALIPIKRKRRVEIGPFVTIYFESFETMLAQVQEMLHIEKGGEDQIRGELEAYNPLIPKGNELIATMMIEIDEPVRRAAMLHKLAGIEETAYLMVGAAKVAGRPADYEDRTSEDGKTSSVHWIRFGFAPGQIAAFKDPANMVVLGLSHENYGHMAVVPPETRAELATDFA
jgi:Protein of unknown function (DUF3501)